MTNIGIITANYARLNVFHIFCEGIKRLREETGQRIHCITSGSIDAIPLCKEYDIEFYDIPNKPLTNKFNNSMDRMVEKDDVDAVMLMGSDDILSTATFLALQKEMDDPDMDMVGLSDLYFFSLNGEHEEKLLYLRQTSVLGPGRVIKKSIIQGLSHPVWRVPKDRGIDSAMLDSVRSHVKKRNIIGGYHLFDLKSNMNINSIDFWAKQLPQVSNDILWDNIGSKETKLIKEYLSNN